MKNVLIFNSGSSSIKFQIIAMPDQVPLAWGQIERIGLPTGNLTLNKSKGYQTEVEQPFKNHESAFEALIPLLSEFVIDIVAHRIVHGGELFSDTTLLTKEVLNEVEKVSNLAPLHNPANLLGVKMAIKNYPNLPQVGVFDTAFHQTMPEKAFRYALPNELYQNHGIRKYGFHGTSHKYVSKKALEFLELEEQDSKLIILHLGNGCSVSAVKNGKCIDTSMGLSPLPGLVMGTRSGDIDPTVIFHLVHNLNYPLKEVDAMLNKKSGLKGLSTYSDMRQVLEASEDNPEAKLALDIYTYRIQTYIGSYFAILGGLHALIFTAGVGENSPEIRSKVVSGLEHLGFNLDLDKNKNRYKTPVDLSTQNAPAKVLVIPTNEEGEIAKQAFNLIVDAQ
jgi:acetate kinase